MGNSEKGKDFPTFLYSFKNEEIIFIIIRLKELFTIYLLNLRRD
jgi:hypothetical protein